MIDIAHRQRVTEVVGSPAEATIYLYASADRAVVYPQIGRASRVSARDRFTGATRELSDAELHDFVELTAANELDVIAHNSDLAAQYGAQLGELVRRATPWLSFEAVRAWGNVPRVPA